MSALSLTGVNKAWTTGGLFSRRQVPVLRNLDLEVAEGERVGLIGESGSGKSTLASVALGMTQPESGSVTLLGEDTTDWNARRWRRARRHAQLLVQEVGAMVHPTIPVGLLLRESARLHQPDVDATEAARRALGDVGLSGRESAVASELSGGELRRVGLARVLLARPRLLIADEPTAGLDAARKADLVELLLSRMGPDCAVVLVSHDLPLVLWATDRVVVLSDGMIVDSFTPDELDSDAPRHERTLALIGAAGLRHPGRR